VQLFELIHKTDPYIEKLMDKASINAIEWLHKNGTEFIRNYPNRKKDLLTVVAFLGRLPYASKIYNVVEKSEKLSHLEPKTVVQYTVDDLLMIMNQYNTHHDAKDAKHHRLKPLTNVKAFKNWFGKSKAVNPRNGSPLILFRGTKKNAKAAGFNTRLSSVSFVASADIASVYAASSSMFGGNEFKRAASVTPVFLSIQKPVVFGYENGYLDDILGEFNFNLMVEEEQMFFLNMIEELEEMFDKGIEFKHSLPSEWIGEMDWGELYEAALSAFQEINDSEDDSKLGEILMGTEIDVYAVVDTPAFVKWATFKGYDGVIHEDVFEGGATAAKDLLGKEPSEIFGLSEDLTHTTYRPFHRHQVKSIFNIGTWDKDIESMSEDE